MLLSAVWLASVAAIFGVVMGSVVVTRQSVIARGSSVLTTRDGESVVQTTPFSASMVASSTMPDNFWQGLTHLTLVSPTNSWLRLSVDAVARIYDTGTEGSIMKVVTPSGTIQLDGTVMSFSTTMAPLF